MANSYLNRTTGSPTLGTKVTVSAWIKISEVPGGSGTDRWLFGEYGNGSNHSYLYLRNSSEIGWYEADGSGTVASIITNRLCRDLNGWYHFMIVYDTTLSTQADRFKMYINGERQTSFSTNTNNIAQDYLPRINRTGRTYHIGGVSGYQTMFNGYMSHVAQVDGQALAPTVFGQTDSTSGIWKFKSPTGVTWGNNGYHLKMENSGAMGTDSSGNSNTFTVNGDLKQALDTPSNVYATLNSLPKSGVSFSYGNLQADNQSADWTSALATFGSSTGKWYAEFKVTDDASGTTRNMFGVCDARDVQIMSEDELGQNTSNRIGDTVGYSGNGTGNCLKNGSDQGSGFNTTYTIGDIISVALDCDNGAVYIAKNGTYLNSGSPTSGASKTGAVTITTGETYLIGGTVYSSTYQANYGNGYFGTTAITSAGSNGNGSLFEYDVPSGYYALNTKNINTYG